MKFKFIIAIAIFTAVNINASTLEELQKRAIENRKVIDKYKQNIQMAKHDVNVAKSGYHPSIDVVYTTEFIKQRYISMRKQGFTGSISYNLFAGFRDKYNIESTEYILDSKELEAQSIVQDIKKNVALYYTDIYSKKSVIKVSQKKYEALIQLYSDSKKKFEVGILNRSDLLSIKVEQDNAYIDLKRAQASLQMSLNELSRATNSHLELKELDFDPFSSIPKIEHIEKNVILMFTKRSDIKMLKKLIEASKSQINIANSFYYPSVNIAGTYNRYDDNFINGNGNRFQDDEVRVQLSVSYNLYDGRAKDAKKAKAKAYEYSLRDDLMDLEATLGKELKNIYLEYEVSKSNIDVTITGIELAEENLRIAKLSAEEGLTTTSDLLEAITNLARAQMNSINAKSALFVSYFNITRLIEKF